MNLDYTAKLTIHDADKLNKRQVAAWLEELAKTIRGKDGSNLAKRFTARLMK
jgi:uncharacterized protein YfdQ (DUF2303 family)